MRSLLGRFHRPMSRGLVNNMLTMNNLGDGSTLSLDFTTGVLDPRLTFSRASTATFVNSSGYVQFANANCFTYSNPRPSGTAWGTTGTVTWNGVGAIADPIGGTNAQSFNLGTTGSAIFNTAGTIVVSGITHTFSVWLRTVTGTTNARIGSSNTGAVSTITVTDTWQRFSCQYVTNGTNDGGAVFSQTGSPSATMYVWGAQIQPGSIVGDLIQTSGTQNYSTPRFDYSPTNIGEPRGLLIEGQGINLLSYSAETSNVYWQKYLCTISGTLATAPDNTTSARLVVEDSGSIEPSLLKTSNTVDVSSAYTLSVWFKAPTSNARRYINLRINDNSSNANAASLVFDSQTGTISGAATAYGTITAASGSVVSYPGSWYRVSLTFTIPASGITQIACKFQLSGAGTRTADGSASPYTGDGVSGMYVWGTQLEKGSGASSYIPTGASTVTRNADACSMTGSDFTNVFGDGSLGTIICSHEFSRADRGVAHQPTPFAIGSYTATNARGFSYGSYTLGITSNYGWVYTSAAFSSAATSAAFAAKNKCGIAYNGLALTAALNGTTNSATGSGTITVSSAIGLQIGYNTTPRDFINACVSNIKFYPTALTAAQLQILTTP